jgi:hypothetical protein
VLSHLRDLVGENRESKKRPIEDPIMRASVMESFARWMCCIGNHRDHARITDVGIDTLIDSAESSQFCIGQPTRASFSAIPSDRADVV